MADFAYNLVSQPVTKDSTSKSFFIYIVTAVGAPATGLAFDSAGLLASYAGTKLARVAITPADLAAITTAWSSGGFKEVDATNMPGWYRIDVPNAALALSADAVVVTVWKSATYNGSILIPLSTKTVEAVSDVLTAADLGNPGTGTLAQNVEAIAAGIPFLDVVVGGQTDRTDH
jgi:hypothetical protein